MTTPHTEGAQPHPQALELTELALARGLAGDWPAAGRAIGQIYRLGGLAFHTLLFAVADTHIAAHEQLLGKREIAGPVWLDAWTGRVGAADDVSPPVRWAGRFVAARAAGDRVTCGALLAVLGGLPADDVNAVVAALVDMCVAIVRLAPCTCGKHR